VWLAWGDADGQQAERHRYSGDRLAVRDQAVREALVGLIRCLEAR